LLAKGAGCQRIGIVYEVGSKPAFFHGEAGFVWYSEAGLGFPPVQAEILTEGEWLPSPSWVDYSKLATVEHHVPVLTIGQVVEEDFNNVVIRAVRECWSNASGYKPTRRETVGTSVLFPSKEIDLHGALGPV
jgi:hypothetical protein